MLGLPSPETRTAWGAMPGPMPLAWLRPDSSAPASCPRQLSAALTLKESPGRKALEGGIAVLLAATLPRRDEALLAATAGLLGSCSSGRRSSCCGGCSDG